ncbi:MAG: hypothetical protein QXQ64_06665 [Candidatus Bathyarchaeia archaeon]
MLQARTVYEYDEIRSDELKLDGRDKKILDGLAYESVLNQSKDGYKATQYVGAIPLHSCVLEILPKIYRGEKDEENKKRNRLALLQMLSFVGVLEIKESELLKKDLKRMNFFELMKYIFAKKLLEQTRDGIYRDYVPFEGNEKYLRGRLDLVKNLRLNYSNRSKFFIRHDDYTEDNVMNRTMASAVREMIPGASEVNRRLLAQLSAVFCDVGYENGSCLLMQRASKNRLNERYWPSYEMAKVFLSRSVPILYSGKDLLTYGFLFDMNYLFEYFVGKFLKRYSTEIFEENAKVELQRMRKFGDLSIIPDVLIKLKDLTIILDTKYKEMPTEISNTDIFQVYTYCMAQKEANKSKEVKGILLYPKHFEKETMTNDLTIKRSEIMVGDENSDFHAKICLRLIDLSMENDRLDRQELVNRFRDLFEEVINEE